MKTDAEKDKKPGLKLFVSKMPVPKNSASKTAGEQGQDRDITIRTMTIDDYDEVYALWKTIEGFGIRSIDDSREGTERFLKRNPTTSVVALDGGKIVGSILCGHDGRTGCFYHVCVKKKYRKQGIGKQMATAAMRALQAEHINKVNLIAFKKNEGGNAFWKCVGWKCRTDVNYYDFVLNEKNITRFNELN